MKDKTYIRLEIRKSTLKVIGLIILWILIIGTPLLIAFMMGENIAEKKANTDSLNRIIDFIRNADCTNDLTIMSINDSITFKKECEIEFYDGWAFRNPNPNAVYGKITFLNKSEVANEK